MKVFGHTLQKKLFLGNWYNVLQTKVLLCYALILFVILSNAII